MNLQEAKELALQLMAKHGLIEKGWKFEYDQSKSHGGMCRYSSKIIFLSAPFTEIRSVENVTDTILHEIAHALVPRGSHHNKVWKRKAVEVGCKPVRCFVDAVLEGKYKAVCPNGHIFYSHRKRTRSSSCSLCCPKRYNPNFLLIYKPNDNK